MVKKIAIIGPTASGKTALALDLAVKYNGIILSLDSLAVYKGGDVASAKPTKQEQSIVKHFGIDIVSIDEKFSATIFFDEFAKALQYATSNNQNLFIVGGSSFYLKSIIDGLSELPPISEASKQKAKHLVDGNIDAARNVLQNIDKDWISLDAYRITRGLEIYFETNIAPTIALKNAKKEPLCSDVDLFEIAVDRQELREKIKLRTAQMFDNGLIGEVEDIATHYGRDVTYCKAIGPKEVLWFLDGDMTQKQVSELISIHTSQLAKRQCTFNKTQFKEHLCEPAHILAQKISDIL